MIFNRYWQATMIALARSPRITHFMQSNRSTSSLAEKFVAGKTPQEALSCANTQKTKNNIRNSLYYLGEYVDSTELIEENLNNKLAIIKALKETDLDIHVSVDATQIGHTIEPSLTRKNAFKIAKVIKQLATNKENTNCLMLDMEDAPIVDDIINLHNEIKQQKLPTALTLQAYLKRTENDLQKQIDAGGMVRLVKGAFTASKEISFKSHKDIKENYIHLVELMLSKEAREKNFYPIIATHDDNIHEFAINLAKHNGWKQGEYEFEMLLGVRADVAESLAKRGERVRLYQPFGRDWWPYAIRRIGENPRNAVLLARSLFN